MTESTYIDKDPAEWGEGPWLTEPDRVEFRHAGFPCLLKRHEGGGHWCGYVGVGPDHPWYGRPYYTAEDGAEPSLPSIGVHGGVTYTEFCQPERASGEERGVCHVPAPGEAEDLWWIGFDFAHFNDWAPRMEVRIAKLAAEHDREPFDWTPHKTYRDQAYVMAECQRVAEQAREAGAS